MKQATYNYKGTRQEFHCVVTLKNDGKISHSLPYMDNYNSSAACRYKAKMLGKEIVAADFNHPAVKTFYNEDNSKLIQELKNHTQDLKEVYLELTAKYAKQKYDYAQTVVDMPHSDRMVEWGEERMTTGYYYNYKGEYIYGKHTYAAMSARGAQIINESEQIVICWGWDNFLAREIKAATEHYYQSIDKLAKRLKGKGITDETEFTVKSGRVGMNFECTIFHENTVTKAWTIIASGPVQRPHYRYLVK